MRFQLRHLTTFGFVVALMGSLELSWTSASAQSSDASSRELFEITRAKRFSLLLIENDATPQQENEARDLLSSIDPARQIAFLNRVLESLLYNYPQFTDIESTVRRIFAMHNAYQLLYRLKRQPLPQVQNLCDLRFGGGLIEREGAKGACHKYVDCHNLIFDELRNTTTFEVTFSDSAFCRQVEALPNDSIVRSIKELDAKRLASSLAAISQDEYKSLQEKMSENANIDIRAVDLDQPKEVIAGLLRVARFIELKDQSGKFEAVKARCIADAREVEFLAARKLYNKNVGGVYWNSCLSNVVAHGAFLLRFK